MNTDDPFDLNRFLQAQKSVYETVLAELRAGEKQSHWIWFIFPQLDGLGFSSTAKFYGIKSLDEAKAYLAHSVLGARLRECAAVVLQINGRSAYQIFSSPDDLKVRSCATLFAQVAEKGSVFEQLLEKYYEGEADQKTLKLLDGYPARG